MKSEIWSLSLIRRAMATVSYRACSLFLYTISVYEQMAGVLPVSTKLTSGHISELILMDASKLVLEDSDYVGFYARLMLQRKYFVKDKDLWIRDLLSETG